MQLGKLQESRRQVVLLERVGFGLDTTGLRLEHALGVVNPQLLDLHLGAAFGGSFFFNTERIDLLRLTGGPGSRQGGIRLTLC